MAQGRPLQYNRLVRSSETSVEEYMAALPADRRGTLEAVRAVIRENLDAGFEEGMQYGMIGYHVPHRVYPAGYHTNPKEPLPFLALASQKQNLALYLMHLYAAPRELEWFQGAWAKAGKKLDMGKSCLRFRTLDELALDVLGEALRRVSAKDYVELYETQRAGARKKVPAKKPPAKKPPAKKKAKVR